MISSSFLVIYGLTITNQHNIAQEKRIRRMKKDVNHSRSDKKEQENSTCTKKEHEESASKHNDLKFVIYSQLLHYLFKNISHTYAWVGFNQKHILFQNILQ